MIRENITYKYLDALVDRLYMILPLFEERNIGLYNYIQSLIFELYGLQYVIEKLNYESKYITLLATLEALSDEVFVVNLNVNDEPRVYDQMHPLIKREVFKCTNIAQSIKESFSTGDFK